MLLIVGLLRERQGVYFLQQIIDNFAHSSRIFSGFLQQARPLSIVFLITKFFQQTAHRFNTQGANDFCQFGDGNRKHRFIQSRRRRGRAEQAVKISRAFLRLPFMQIYTELEPGIGKFLFQRFESSHDPTTPSIKIPVEFSFHPAEQHPRHRDNFFMQAFDLRAGVNKQAGGGFRIFVKEQAQAFGIGILGLV